MINKSKIIVALLAISLCGSAFANNTQKYQRPTWGEALTDTMNHGYV